MTSENKPDRWQEIVDEINYKSENQTTKQMIAWQVELQKRKKLIDDINKKSPNVN